MNRTYKSIVLCFFLIIFSLFVTSCGQRLKSEAEANDYVAATAYRDNGQRLTFTGSVRAVGEYSLTILPDEGSAFSGKGEIRVAVSGSDPVLDEDGNRISLSDLAVGDRVRIRYSGTVLSGDPMRIAQCNEVRKIS